MYTFERFGSITLAGYGQSVPLDSGAARTAFVDTAGGELDTLGSNRAHLKPVDLTYRCVLIGTSSSDVHSQEKNLRALVGKLERLYRRNADSSMEWTMARLLNVRATRVPKNEKRQEFDLDFHIALPVWNGKIHGEGWTLDAGVYLDTGYMLDTTGSFPFVTSATVENAGNFPARNLVIEIQAGPNDITAFELSVSGVWHLVYDGTIESGTSLIIDCGAFSVMNNGTDDFDSLSRGSGHAIPELARLEPGDNVVSISKTGGHADDVIIFTFSESWV